MLEVSIARSVGSLDLDVELSVSSGTVLVAGPNGAGKTTLLHLILGISRPDAGRILLDGRPLFDGRVDVPAERRRLGYVPQDSALFPHLDVLGNVAFGLGHLPRA
jgi:ABC-type sulfate/molybdate transport systems ATPase subunit